MTAAVSRADLAQRARQVPARRVALVGIVLAVVGGAAVVSGLLGGHPDRTWWAYHANFVFWAGLAQGMVVFAATQKLAKGHWSGVLTRRSGSARPTSGPWRASASRRTQPCLGRVPPRRRSSRGTPTKCDQDDRRAGRKRPPLLPPPRARCRRARPAGRAPGARVVRGRRDSRRRSLGPPTAREYLEAAHVVHDVPAVGASDLIAITGHKPPPHARRIKDHPVQVTVAEL